MWPKKTLARAEGQAGARRRRPHAAQRPEAAFRRIAVAGYIALLFHAAAGRGRPFSAERIAQAHAAALHAHGRQLAVLRAAHIVAGVPGPAAAARFAAEQQFQLVAVHGQQFAAAGDRNARVAQLGRGQAVEAVAQVGADAGGAYRAGIVRVGQFVYQLRAERRDVAPAHAGVGIDEEPVLHQLGVGCGVQVVVVAIAALPREVFVPAVIEIHAQARTRADEGDGGRDFRDEIGLRLAGRRAQGIVRIAFAQAQRRFHQPVDSKGRQRQQQR